MKSLSILGSTGSIGRQTLDIVRAHASQLRVIALAAGENSLPMLAEQIKQFHPEMVCLPNAASLEKLKEAGSIDLKSTEFVFGAEGLEQVAAHPSTDIVVSGVVGFLGVKPTAAAIRAGKTIALANKETLVAAGAAIMPMVNQHGARIIPVDSEHSAIHQSLTGYGARDLRSIWLTASGGPFRTWTREAISNATVDDALKHPNWSMGQKITIDSATLMNKGLEIIEARWLFDVSAEKIKVIIHPQSILHSAVEFVDGSVVGQMGIPDMHLPIHYALFWPERTEGNAGVIPALDLVKLGTLTFEEPDTERFPCLALAQEAARHDDTRPCVLNAANEVIVEAVLKRRLRFADIPRYVEKVLDLHQPITNPTLDDILECDSWARTAAADQIGALAK
ncbi:MAG: 1-deoxy-D-xylulose-5-phosphate reductoisomerase [Candidatus Obscuribacterales bacterium]